MASTNTVPYDSLGRHLFLRELGDLKRGNQSRTAESYGINAGTFSQLLRGRIEVGLNTAVKIEQKTNGRVPASSWRKPAPKPPRKSPSRPPVKKAS
jgi:hypothetical protein